MHRWDRSWVLALGLAAVAMGTAGAQAPASSPVAWLRYAIPPDPPRYHDMPHTVVVLGDASGQPAPEEAEAAEELDRGLGHMVAGTDQLLHRFDPELDAIVLGTTEAVHRARLGRSLPGWTEKSLPEEGFRIVHLRRGIRHWWILQGGSPRAELWAAYRFAALVAADQQLPEELVESPKIAHRVLALDWRDGRMAGDVRETARMMASVGMNGLSVGGVPNGYSLEPLERAVRPFGIRVWRENVLHESPPADGSPVDARKGSVEVNVEGIPVNGSLTAPPAPFRSIREGMVGWSPMSGLAPSQFRVAETMPLAELAEFALAPGGLRMPVLPMVAWQRALQTPIRRAGAPRAPAGTLLEAVATGAVLGKLEPDAAEALHGNPLLQANVYAFGRMAWDPSLSPDRVVDEWARQTWGDDARVFAVAKKIVLDSAKAYVDLVSPLGLPPLVNGRAEVPTLPMGFPALLDGRSDGPVMGAAGALADAQGVGVDATALLSDYPDAFAAELRDPARTPEEWLLAVHRVPYSSLLRSGKTVTQAFYDAHFAGSSTATNAVDAWEETRELVDAPRYRVMLALLEENARRAEIWRESTTEWMARVSGMPDASGFVGRHAGRVEAESMESVRYASQTTAVPEDASAAALSVCHEVECSVATRFRGEENVYRVEIGYFDERVGSATFALRVNGKVRARWSSVPRGTGPCGVTAERLAVNGIRLKGNDRVEIDAVPHDGAEAALDFVEITRDPRWN